MGTTRKTNDRPGAVSIFGGGNSALSISAVFRCVNVLAGSVASMPLRYMKKRGEQFVFDPSERINYLFNVQPCAALSAYDFWFAVVQDILLDGNAYIVPKYSAANPSGPDSLVLVPPSCVGHDTMADTYTVNYPEGGIYAVFQEQDIIHIKNYTPDGKTGVSTLRYAGMTIDTATAGEAEALARFATGGNVRGIVSNGEAAVKGFGEYQDSQLEAAAQELDAKFQNGEKIVSIPGQAEFKTISLSSVDMQFLESRKFTIHEICRFFNVPPAFVFEESASNYKDAEKALSSFNTNSIGPILKKIENELERKLIAPSLAGTRHKIEFDRTAIYASDLASRIKYQAAAIGAGLYSVNDMRKKENMPPVEGGDKILVSANLKPLKEDGTSK